MGRSRIELGNLLVESAPRVCAFARFIGVIGLVAVIMMGCSLAHQTGIGIGARFGERA